MKKTIYLFLSFLLFNMLIGASLFAQNGTIGIKQLKVRNAQDVASTPKEKEQYLETRLARVAAYKKDLENRLQQVMASPDRNTPKMQQTEKLLRDELLLLEEKMTLWKEKNNYQPKKITK
ncbi:MAG: hypothetical protein KA168_00210 [Chitinophagales bacterium]|nr:hypothetical protein [Chitinophagales bacterium]